jgi:hypothetical protein
LSELPHVHKSNDGGKIGSRLLREWPTGSLMCPANAGILDSRVARWFIF